MIGKISGVIDYKADDHVLIEAAGVGYVVHCGPGTVAALPGPGEAASLYTELVVREDLMQLFGFRTLGEREWHRLLTSVQGVGARVSLALIDALGVAGLGRALAAADATALRRAPGVGPKLAARIANELKGKAPAMMALGAGPRTAPAPGATAPKGKPPAVAPTPEEGELAASADALSALVNLGYDRMEAAAAIAEAGAAGAVGETALIRSALRSLGRNL
jgi:Holliday junction DNA helicase RuvA